MTRIQSLLVVSTLMIVLASCQPSEPAAPAPASEPAAPETPESTAPPATEEVSYEPAYPTDVSSEGLSEGDVEQQEASHSHGGAEHSHDDGEHSHGEGEEDPADHDHKH